MTPDDYFDDWTAPDPEEEARRDAEATREHLHEQGYDDDPPRVMVSIGGMWFPVVIAALVTDEEATR